MRIKGTLIAALCAMPLGVFATSTPTGLNGVATTPTNVQWNWNSVGGATNYKVYISTPPPTLLGTTASTTWNDGSLQPNMPVFRAVTAIMAAVESPLSQGVTVYTLANMPGVPNAYMVGASSFTVVWTTGNPSYTRYEVSLALNNSFTVGVTTPVLFSDNLTANTTTLINLTPSTNYFVRIRARNQDLVPSNPSPVTSVTTTGGGGGGGAAAGAGVAVIAPTVIQEGAQIQTTTLTYVVPTGGFTSGGGLMALMPNGWGPFLQNTTPGNFGHVSAVTTPAKTLVINPSNTEGSVQVTLAAGQTLAAGDTIYITISGIWTNCPLPGQTTHYWNISSRPNNTTAFAALATQPFIGTTVGMARFLSFRDWSNLTVGTGQASSAIVIEGRSYCGKLAPLGGTVPMQLTGSLPDYSSTDDPSATFSTDAGFSVPVTSVTISTGASQATFYYKTTTPGNNLQIRASYLDIQGGYNTNISRYVNVLNTNVTFNNLVLENGAAGSTGSTSFTLSPDNDGTNDFVFIRFQPSDVNLQWKVRISADASFNTWIYERTGFGDPLGSLQWDGRNTNGGGAANNFVPAGTYYVRVEIPGLTPNNTLTITVETYSIAGRVLLGGSGMPNAWVNANATSGYGYGGANTDSNGDYIINGLRNGQSYNLFTNFYDTTTQRQMNGSLTNITAPATGQNISISQPAIIRVAATVTPSPVNSLFGSVNAHDSNYSQNFYGSIRVQAGLTTSDNGDSFQPSTWTILVVQPGKIYTVQLNMPGFTPATQTINVTNGGQTYDLPIFNLTRPANVYGRITLPAALPNSAWISVEGKIGSANPTVWGGVFLNGGDTTGIYQLYNVPSGQYSFRLKVPGYVAASTSALVSGTDIGDSVSGGLDLGPTAFTTGRKLSGTITIQGDSTGLGVNIPIWLNAYSPSLGSGVFTQLSMASNASESVSNYEMAGLDNGTYQIFPPYLAGFELSPPGPKSVTIAGADATLNLLLKQNLGAISGTITLPTGKNDYDQVSISLQGPNMSTRTVATGASYSITGLSSGFYDVTAFYATSGAQRRQSVAVVNATGQTSNLDLLLNAPTYGATGTVTIQTAFTITPTTGTPVTINTITDMLSNQTNQSMFINGVQQSFPTARVEAFPKRFDSYGGANRTGFSNNFFAADYKFGAIQADGTFSIAGLTPGVWELNVYPYLDGGYTPSFAAAKQTYTITVGTRTGVNFNISAGYSVSGTVSLPGGASDFRNFNVTLLTDRGDHIQSSYLSVGNAGANASSSNFLFNNLPSGRYVLKVEDPGTFDATLNQNVRKYVSKPLAIEIISSNVTGLTLTMSRASRIVGKLSIRGKNADGTANSTLVTANNSTLLPDNFRINAAANPWIEGGYQMATGSMGMGMGRIDIDANNQFHIDGLMPATYDVQFRQDTFGSAITGRGSANLASYTQGQVKVSEGQVVDLGTIELKQGLSLTGTVQDSNGNFLPNIRVRSRVKGNNDKSNNSETFTDAVGQFTLTGLNPDLKTYDIIAAPRPSVDDLMPPSPYGQSIKKAVDMTVSPLPTLSFTLLSANASVDGTVSTIDNGPLGYPDGDKQQGFPAAAVYMQMQGVASSNDDPLGEIRGTTNISGAFSITSLVPGKYDVQVISLNYKPYKFTMTINAGSNTADPVVLGKGAALNTTIVKPDGSGVNTEDVEFAVAVTADLGVIIFGQIQADENTRTIRSIRFSGFDSTKRFNVLLFDKNDNITAPNEGKNLTFTSDSEEKTLAMTYQQSAPTAYAQVRKVNSDVEVTFYFSRTLRNTLPADNDVTILLSKVSGGGTFNSFAISSDRRSLSVLYTPLAGEDTATIRFSGSTADVDPATGTEFAMVKNVLLRFGQNAVAEKNISPVLGGEVTLSDTSGDPSGVTVPGNALKAEDGSAADADANFAISFTVTDDETNLPTAAPRPRAAALAQQVKRGASAYVPEAYHAMQTARASATINPFSAFYSVLLPAGLSHTLNETATLTLQYDTDADPNAINIYFFDGTKYLIENADRTIDTVNHTITVSVSHFSTFVVLDNSSSVIFVDGDSGTASEIDVYNFPNPFNLQSKQKDLAHGGSTPNITTNGTIIRYVIPAAKAGPAHIDIYNVVGEKVRDIDLGTPTADTYHYVEWDGKNDHGNNVASGVYLGVLKVGGEKKIWKMAVIK